MSNKFLKIVSKNLKLLLRSKRSAFIVIIGPLIIMLLVGLAFNNASSYNINVGVYSDSFSETSNLFVSELDEEFNTITYDNFERCVADVKHRTIHACVVFPANMEIINDVSNEIVFHLDESNVNLAWMVSKSVSDIAVGKSSELSLDMTNVLLSRIDLTRGHLSNQSEDVNDLLSKADQLTSTTSAIRSSANSFSSNDLDALAEDVTSLKDIADDLAETFDKLIDDVTSKANSLPSEASSQETEIKNLLTAATTKLETMKTDIDALDVSDMDSLVSKISNSQSNIISKSSSISSDISSSIDLLNSMQDANTELNNSIESIGVTSASSIVSPIKTKVEPITTESTHLNYLLPALLVLLVMFVSVMLSCSIVIREKTSNAFFRNFTAPVKNITFVTGNFISSLFILVLQLAIILSVAYWGFNINILNNFGVTLLIVAILVILFIFLGMLIGTVFNKEETAMLAAVSVSSVLLFLSNLILPLESMPDYIKQIADFNPFVMGEALIKKSMLFGIDLYTLSNEIYILLAYAAGVFILMLLLQQVMKLRFLHLHAAKAVRNRDKEKLERKLSSAFDAIKPGQYFKLDDGSVIKSLKDMVEALEYMDDKTFRRYSNRDKNDFANWAKYVLKNSVLSRELAKIKTRKELIERLKDQPKKKKGLLGLFKRRKNEEKDSKKKKKKPEKEGLELAEDMKKKDKKKEHKKEDNEEGKEKKD